MRTLVPRVQSITYTWIASPMARKDECAKGTFVNRIPAEFCLREQSEAIQG